MSPHRLQLLFARHAACGFLQRRLRFLCLMLMKLPATHSAPFRFAGRAKLDSSGWFSVLSSCLVASLSPSFGASYNVMDFGAVPDGVTYNTAAIQQAIEAAAAKGGGEVVIPKGNFLSRRIELRNNITLRLEQGATLLGPPTPAAYNGLHYLIYAYGVTNVAVVGPGQIEGQAKDDPSNAFWYYQTNFAGFSYDKRPETDAANLFFFCFRNCTNVLFQDFTINHSPAWTILAERCENIIYQNIKLNNSVFGPNTDGLDIVGSRNVLVTGCEIRTCDDAIVPKSPSKGMVCENLVVTNCVLRSPSYGFKIGTESAGIFQNVRIEAPDERGIRGGVSLQCVDGGRLSEVTLSNLKVTGARAPISIRLGDRRRANRPAGAGLLRNVVIENFTATLPHHKDWSSTIAGLPGYCIENILLTNLDITVLGTQSGERASKVVDEVPDKYPDAQMFGDLPSYGFYCRHVRGVAFANVRVRCANADGRPAIVCDDVTRLSLDQFITDPKRPVDDIPEKRLFQFRTMPEMIEVTQRSATGGAWTLTTPSATATNVVTPFTR
jgi:hypothetical protein